MLQEMVDNIWKEYYTELSKGAENNKPTPQQQEAITKALVGNFPELPGLIKKNIEEVQQSIDDLITANEGNTPKSIWSILGIDPDSPEGQEAINALKEGA